MTIQETAALLQTMDRVLLLTHVRPDGDTIGSAAALCRALRDLGKTAYLLCRTLLGGGGLRAGFRGVGGHCGPGAAAGERQEIRLPH